MQTKKRMDGWKERKNIFNHHTTSQTNKFKFSTEQSLLTEWETLCTQFEEKHQKRVKTQPNHQTSSNATFPRPPNRQLSLKKVQQQSVRSMNEEMKTVPQKVHSTNKHSTHVLSTPSPAPGLRCTRERERE